jgi:hypothetical protein
MNELRAGKGFVEKFCGFFFTKLPEIKSNEDAVQAIRHAAAILALTGIVELCTLTGPFYPLCLEGVIVLLFCALLTEYHSRVAAIILMTYSTLALCLYPALLLSAAIIEFKLKQDWEKSLAYVLGAVLFIVWFSYAARCSWKALRGSLKARNC